MKDFEQLLEDTLRDVREAEPLAGIDARIQARIAEQGKRGQRWHLLSGAVAAGLLVTVLFHAGMRVQNRLPVAASLSGAPHGDDASGPASLSAEGATYTSLGRRPRDAPSAVQRGLKARNVGPLRTFIRRSRSLPRNASLHIVPVVMAPLRMEPIEVASLTLKNPNARGEPQ